VNWQIEISRVACKELASLQPQMQVRISKAKRIVIGHRREFYRD